MPTELVINPPDPVEFSFGDRPGRPVLASLLLGLSRRTRQVGEREEGEPADSCRAPPPAGPPTDYSIGSVRTPQSQ